MKRHEFEPGTLVAGVVFAALAVVCLLDALGRWSMPGRWAAVLTVTGLVTACVAGVVNSGVRALLRRGRSRRVPSGPGNGPDGGALRSGGTGGSDGPDHDGFGVDLDKRLFG